MIDEPTRAAVARATVRVVRLAIGLTFVAGIRRGNPGAVVNAVVAYAGTYLPRAVEHIWDVEFRPWQRAYAATAMATHAVGMLGPYDDVWWWDHLTHVHSASLLGGLAHVLARRRDWDPCATVLRTVVAGGLLWEAVEYAIHLYARRRGFEPLLVTYGKLDTTLDLCFNAVGALLVVAFGDRLLANLDRSEDVRK